MAGVEREKPLKSPNRLGLGYLVIIKLMIYIKIYIEFRITTIMLNDSSLEWL